MSQSFIINLLGGTVWAQHPVDTFRGNGRHMPFATYARHCGGNCRWRRRRSSLTPHVLAETAKLDGFAYTHVATVHTCMQFVLPPVQEGGNALSVPGHLVQTPTADLLLRPATVINHSGATLLNTYSAAPPTYFCTLRKIPSLYVLWRDSSPFSLIRAQSVVFAACSLSVKEPHRISNKPFSIFTFKRPRLCKIPSVCVF